MSPLSLAPAMLLSMPQLVDPNFSRTVVLLCKHSIDAGAFGLVVNRPLVTTGPVVVEVRTEAHDIERKTREESEQELQVWVGGPVDPQRTLILVGHGHDADEEQCGMRIADGVSLSTSPDLLHRLLGPSPPARAPCGRLCRMEPGSARGRAREIGLAHQRRQSRLDLLDAAGSHVGSGHPPPGRRSGRAADVARGALGREGLEGRDGQEGQDGREGQEGQEG